MTCAVIIFAVPAGHLGVTASIIQPPDQVTPAAASTHEHCCYELLKVKNSALWVKKSPKQHGECSSNSGCK
jgi:hypothetical protein